MLSDAQAKCLLHCNPDQSEEWGEGLNLNLDIQYIQIDPDTGNSVGQGTASDCPIDTTLDVEIISPDQAAYIFFTSGTTGTPKGILGSHKGLAHFLHWQRQTFTVKRSDRIAQLTGLSFDVLLRDIFLPLTSGATLCLPDPRMKPGDPDMMDWLVQQRITLLHTVPTLAQAWLTTLSEFFVAGPLRGVFFAGEPLSDQLVNDWRRVFPRCQDMINLYGPTETTLAKAYYQVPAEPVPGIQPIGQPLPDTQLWVLNPQGQPAGIGEIGEIVIRTPFRTLGYINASQGERHRFQPNPFSNDPNDIIYYTGDFGRYQPNGTLDILGRRDHQVKIRGVRIELGEIENALAGHSHIHHAIATMVEQPPGNQYLAAYVVPHAAQTSQTSLQPESLRQYLKQRLPDYMLPSVFVVLDHLPLTTNGKVNRKALPLPPALRDTPDALVAPQTETQRLIAACFATVLFLPVEQIGLYDSFFILGGHSLLAMQLMMRLRDTFEVELPLRKVFESPTVAALEAVLTSDFAPGQTIPAIIPIEQDGTSIPLSYAQERLWFLAQLEGLSATYNLPAAVQIEGSLDINALEYALEVLVTRHDVLRTTFPIVNGTAVQKIAPSLHIPLQSIAASTLTSTPSDWLIQETQCPFDLEQGPLLRVKLLHLSKDTSVLTVIMHHIISDGWSVGVFIRELTTLYKAYRQGQPCPFPSLPIQYVDYTFWQRQWLHGEVLDTQLNYWRQQLSQIPTLLELPTDHPRPAVQRSHGRTYTSTLPLSLSEQIKALAQEQGVTTFMTLLAAFQVLLYRYSGQQDILVGTPIANRQRPELESLIGFFVNTLVLRTQIQPTASVTDLLCQVKRMALDAYAHQDVPFEQVVEMLQPDRTLAHAPLFQVMFVLQNMPMASIELPDLTLTPLAAETVTAKFDLTLSMEDTEQGLVGRWEYNSDLFEPNTITRMAAHFETLLHAMVKDRSQSIATLPLLSTAERSQLLGEWNNTAASYPQSQCIHQLFEAQVEKTPDAVAVVFEGQSITYKILNAQANQLAHYLQDLGVRPEMLVGICLERSIDMIVGLLGILKAGGAYVPLDPNYPPQRLQFMLRDAQVTVLVTQKSLLETLPEHHVRTVCLRRDKDSLAQASEANLRNQITASNLAYMIYTSGSTGRPKGVMIPHSNLVNAYVAWEKAYQLRTEVHSHLQMASFSFDVFTGDWVRALCSGGKLVLCPRSLLLEPEKLYFLLQQEKIDCAEFVPAVLRSLMDYLGATHQDLHFMRLLAVGSDSWYLDEFHKLGCLCGDASRIINSYGVTEATIDSSYFETTPLKLSSQQLVPIGRPFANSQLYILDTHLNPVPIGVTGELYIGGPGVARGYWNLPELTASRFIPIPFGKSSDDHRIYRTGDQARYLPDGNIELLGRVDHQVKIRGYRIELGAIESLLNQLEEVQQSVVITHGDSADNRRLVTYLVSDGDIEINSLKRYLKQHLPDYMVPNIVIPLATLPLTPNGKIDRQALPCPTGPFLQQNSYVAPRNTTELTLTQLWSDVLNVDPISVQATFFDLGGHSLLAVRLMAKIQTTFQIDLPLATLFQYPTVEQLAQQLAVGSRAEDIALVPIQPQGNCLPLFCIHPVGGNVLCYQALSQHLGQDYPVYGLQSLGLAGQQSPLRTIEAMASHYLEEIMAVQPRGPYRLIGWSMGGVIAYEMAQQLTHRGESVELLGLIDGYSYIPPVNGEPVENQNHLLAELIKDLAGQTGRPVPSELYSFKAQSISLEQALDLLQKHQFLPDHMPLDQLGRLWQVFQANTQALYQYRPQPYNGSALLLVASESLMHAKEPDVNGWQQADWNTIISELDVHTITADHFSLVTESSNVAQVVQYLKQNLISVHLSAR
ncbi:MAG: amino acid adenylation domain-containing protein [Cyanobacteria bacterium P01_F01_bin.150]